MFYDEGGETLAWVAQRGGRCPIPGTIPGQVGRGSEHPALVEDVPAHGMGGWAGWSLKVPSHPTQSVFLWFQDGIQRSPGAPRCLAPAGTAASPPPAAAVPGTDGAPGRRSQPGWAPSSWFLHPATERLENSPPWGPWPGSDGSAPPPGPSWASCAFFLCRWIRGEHFKYKFSRPGGKHASEGRWWIRKRIGPYFPPVNLQGLKKFYEDRNWPYPVRDW